MNKIPVSLKKQTDESYDIHIGSGVTELISRSIGELELGHSYAVITDSNVEKLYGVKILRHLKNSLSNVHMISFPAGEASKSREMKSQIEDAMFELKLGRDSAVIALGGGVVGDLAGYIAATYTRGVPYVQIPTSLVACVDSSVGGKTGIDTKFGKNLIGAFHQPRAVFIDTDTLKTLSRKEINEGLAEIIKYGIIRDRNLFGYLNDNIEGVYDLNSDVLTRIIETSCRIKADVVEKDEKESNLRKILNFGHTVGHAVEKLSDFSISHGEAISIGMVIESGIALSLTDWKTEDHEKLLLLLSRTDLPVKLPEKMDTEELLEIMKKDKKSRKGNIEMSLPGSIGNMHTENGEYGIKIPENLIKSVCK